MDSRQIYDFVGSFPKAVGAAEVLLQYTDESGNGIVDYLKTGSTKVNITEFANKKKTSEIQKKIDNFDLDTCATKQSAKKFSDFNTFMYQYFAHRYCSQLAENYDYDGVDLKRGMKTSRAFNKVCVHYGIDKAKNYDKLFAQYADLVSANARKLHFVISLNPLDYLTMSIGKSWTSCHSIKGNNGYAGGACNGCVSYMLDNVSIITYVVDKMDENLHNVGKMYRQMYHYNDNLFVQSRLYPQGNDGATDLYAKFRGFMIDEFSELLGIDENAWVHQGGTSYTEAHIRHTGNHYPDTRYNRSVGIFYPKANTAAIRTNVMTVGATSYCFHCGQVHNERSRLSHVDCTE
jgi:hypothetical protein